ncbi:MAG: GTPase HflX [bacterium]
MEKYIAVGLSSYIKTDQEKIKILLDELKILIKTLGSEITESFFQSRISPDPKYFIGSGKLTEIKQCAHQLNLQGIIFVNEISPSQIRNIEDFTELKIITRRDVILDIFARHASSQLAKAEVEMAQLKHISSRLVGSTSHLSRLGGGIGTRGPGEKKLEMDRRNIQKRMKTLTKTLEKNKKALQVQRKRRKNVYQISLVGYTNAGKSTLLNSLTKSKVLVANQLFSTIDTTTRKLASPYNSISIILSDTVGFILDLPPELIDSFQATLDEVVQADLRLIVIDLSDPLYEIKLTSVEKTLKRLNCLDLPKFYVYNKIDTSSVSQYPNEADTFYVSARTGEGLDNLKNALIETAKFKQQCPHP